MLEVGGADRASEQDSFRDHLLMGILAWLQNQTTGGREQSFETTREEGDCDAGDGRTD